MRPVKLRDGTIAGGLSVVSEMFDDLDAAVRLLDQYMALNAINLFLVLLRVIKLMDFQPRLGVITRTLW